MLTGSEPPIECLSHSRGVPAVNGQGPVEIVSSNDDSEGGVSGRGRPADSGRFNPYP
jgi:hypothetical protein